MKDLGDEKKEPWGESNLTQKVRVVSQSVINSQYIRGILRIMRVLTRRGMEAVSNAPFMSRLAIKVKFSLF